MKTCPSEDGNPAFVSMERGEDLLVGVNAAVAELGIEAGTLKIIGGLEEAVLGYFDPGAAE